jgi:transcription antitermination factor NusG
MQSNFNGDVSKRQIDHGSTACESAPKWFAVYTGYRHEKRVAEHFGQRQIEFFLPLYRVQRKWKDGSKVNLELPLFPCYIFARIGLGERVRVLEVPGVQCVVGGTAREPAPLPDADINTLRSGLDSRSAEPHPLLLVGQRARIRSGALAGMEGVVVRKKNGLRVVLTLNLIMQSIAVEVDSDDLEPQGSGLVHDSGASAITAYI